MQKSHIYFVNKRDITKHDLNKRLFFSLNYQIVTWTLLHHAKTSTVNVSCDFPLK